MDILRFGQLTDAPTRNWLTRVLGSPQALSRLTGPRAVTMTNGRGILRAMLLMAIPRLLTILRSVDRAPGDVWPTLLVSMTEVKTGFLWNLNLLCPRLQKAIFIILEGSKLGANRICPKLAETEPVKFWVNRAPLALGPLLSRTRLLITSVAMYRPTGTAPLTIIPEIPLISVPKDRRKLWIRVAGRGSSLEPTSVGSVDVVVRVVPSDRCRGRDRGRDRVAIRRGTVGADFPCGPSMASLLFVGTEVVLAAGDGPLDGVRDGCRGRPGSVMDRGVDLASGAALARGVDVRRAVLDSRASLDRWAALDNRAVLLTPLSTDASSSSANGGR